MRILKEAWFEFKGIRSDEMGICLRTMPIRFLPGRNITRKTISGRDGALAYGDGRYKDISVRQECDARDETKLSQIAAWLTGSGDLRFSDEPDRVYQASVEKEFSRASIAARFAGQRFTVNFTCAPFKKLYPEAQDIILAANGYVSNPGTVPSLPKIVISGDGEFTLTIGEQTMYFTGVENGIVVDSELMDAMDIDKTRFLNDRISGDFFEIQPGYNTVEWEVTSGEITAIKITPRWRYL